MIRDLLGGLITGLFNALKPLFIVAIIVLVIVIAIYVGKSIYESNRATRNEKKYIDAMKAKYAKRSRSELVEIYNFLMRLENCRANAAKKEARAQNRDEQESALISSMAVTLMEEQLWEKYPFIAYKYRHHDIEYLKRIL